ncbi:DUF3488 and transglutaminase-like domain-containing protein [Rathayibacter sp. YIM 133350]|uniref:transglutaminase family protein n=1 Tax=Rathayibacter sp. YIM 133350 TaxID=3131992 RepID=UPI00307FBA67
MSRSETRSLFATRGRPYWPLTLALLLLLLIGSMALGPVLRGASWWWVMAAVASITLVCSALFRKLNWSPALVPLGAAGVLIVVLTLFFGNGTGLLWLIPTPGTFQTWGSLADAGTLSIQQQAVPAVPYPGIVFLLAVGAGLIAIALDVVGVILRSPAIAGILVLIPMAVPALVTKAGANVWMLVVAAAAYLLVLRVDVRLRRAEEAASPERGRAAPRSVGPVRQGPGPVWGSLGVGVIGVVGALVLSVATPALSDSTLLQSRSTGVLFGAGVSPLIDLGQDLRRPEETLALHYSTDADRQPYFKLLTLDEFSEDRDWVAGHGAVDPANTVERIGPARGLTDDDVKREEVKTSVHVDGVVSSWLPVPYPATSVAGLGGSWNWDADALTVSSDRATTRGQDYTVKSLAVAPTADQLRQAGTEYPADVISKVALPEQTPEVIAQTARDVTAGTDNPYDAAVAMQRYLRSTAFAYSTTAPVDEGYDGGSLEIVAQFLQVKKGYCIHFASTMAVMARTLGIPARLALGYLPGEATRDSFQGNTRWNVSSHDLHVWPELYFPGTGWVSFEPTTGRGSIPDYARAAAAAGTTTAPPTQTDAQERAEQQRNQHGDVSSTTDSWTDSLVGVLQIGGIVVGVLLLLLLPFLVRKGVRFARRRRVRRGRGSPELLWREVADTASDYGHAVPDTETARHLAHRIVGLDSADAGLADSVERLLVAVERERYAPPEAAARDASGLLGDLDLVLAAVRSRATWPARLRAALLPRSLRPAAFGPGSASAATPA